MEQEECILKLRGKNFHDVFDANCLKFWRKSTVQIIKDENTYVTGFIIYRRVQNLEYKIEKISPAWESISTWEPKLCSSVQIYWAWRHGKSLCQGRTP